MMLEHLGEREAATAIVTAFEDVLARGGDALTPDMGGSATTKSLGVQVCNQLETNVPALLNP